MTTTNDDKMNRLKEATRLSREGRDLVASPSAFSRMKYTRVLDESDDVFDAVTKRETKLAEWAPLGRETFDRLLERRTVELPTEQQSAWGRQALAACEENGAWGEIRAASRALPGIAAENTAKLLDFLADAMGVDKMPDDEQRQEDPRDAADAIDQAESMSGMVPADVLDAMRRAAHESNARRDAALANLEQAKASGALSAALTEIAEQATADASAVAMLRGCGLGAESADPDSAIPMELVKAIGSDPFLKQILDLVGRMRDAADAHEAENAPAAAGEITGVTTGRDVRALLPSELALLASPVGLDVARRVVEGSASVWKFNTDAPRGRGDKVILLDQSGSMDTAGRYVFARALVIAALSASVARGESVALVAFAGEGDVSTVHVRPGDDASLRAAIELATVPPHGGTDIKGALRASAQAAEYLDRPDCLLITDANFTAPPRDVVRGACGEDGRLFVVGLGDGADLAMPDADRVWGIAKTPTLDDAVGVLSSMLEEVK